MIWRSSPLSAFLAMLHIRSFSHIIRYPLASIAASAVANAATVNGVTTRGFATVPSPKPRREISPSLRTRLQTLGATCSYEISPSRVLKSKKSGRSGQAGNILNVGAEQLVFVNWVTPTCSHGKIVASACQELSNKGLCAVPHVPVTRFEDVASLEAFLDDLQSAAVTTILLLGGNDSFERESRVPIAHSSAAAFLNDKASCAALRAHGVHTVCISGYPEGHPRLGLKKSDEHLTIKVQSALKAGFNVRVISQFCFDTEALTAWLTRMHLALETVASEYGMIDTSAEGSRSTGGATSGTPTVCFHVGFPAPTPLERLARMADICEVSMYGQLSERSGECAANEPQSPLSFSTAPMAAYGVATKSWQHHHRNDDIATVPANEGAATAGDAHLVWPSEDAVLAVAEFCERNALLPSALCLHLYPFSSDTAMVCELASKLERGTWPP